MPTNDGANYPGFNYKELRTKDKEQRTKSSGSVEMPRACPVVLTMRSYKKSDCDSGCHGLAPWFFTLAATGKLLISSQRELPRAKPVASHQVAHSLL